MRTALHELDGPLLHFSPLDPWSRRDAANGLQIFGAPSAGKTTTVGKQIAHAFLEDGMGGLVQTAKHEETETWIRYAMETGREKDLIVFSENSGHCFDPLFYEFSRPGRGRGDLEAVIDMFGLLLEIGQPPSDKGEHQAWIDYAKMLMRNAIVLLAAAGEPISLITMHRLINTLPTVPGQHENDPKWKEEYCCQVLTKIRARYDTFSDDEKGDLDHAAHFVCVAWPAMDDRPRSSVLFTFSGMSSRFLFNPLSRLFCGGKCTFLPEHASQAGKIVIVDFPMLEYGQSTGVFINCLLKLCFMRAWLRRDVEKHPNMVFLWQDEAANFVLPRNADNLLAQTARGYRIATISLMQSILSLAEALHEPQPGSRTKGWLGVGGATKIFMQNNCVDTNAWAASLIGQEYTYGTSLNVDQFHTTYGKNETLRNRIEPDAFSRLLKPDGENPIAEAVIYKAGQIFESTKTAERPHGRNFMLARFSRE